MERWGPQSPQDKGGKSQQGQISKNARLCLAVLLDDTHSCSTYIGPSRVLGQVTPSQRPPCSSQWVTKGSKPISEKQSHSADSGPDYSSDTCVWVAAGEDRP